MAHNLQPIQKNHGLRASLRFALRPWFQDSRRKWYYYWGEVRAYIAILKDEKNKVTDAVAVALNPRAIERLARRGHRMVFLNAKKSARRISEKLARRTEEEQIPVA